jgi:ABC-type thiamine transport system ATPase subunit
MKLPSENIRLRHYGHLIEELFEQLKNMPEGEERAALVKKTANQMKRDLVMWGHGSSDNERIASDLARFTDGKIQLGLNNFVFEKVNMNDFRPTGKKKK